MQILDRGVIVLALEVHGEYKKRSTEVDVSLSAPTNIEGMSLRRYIGLGNWVTSVSSESDTSFKRYRTETTQNLKSTPRILQRGYRQKLFPNYLNSQDCHVSVTPGEYNVINTTPKPINPNYRSSEVSINPSFSKTISKV